MKAFGAEYGAVGVTFSAINEEVCPGFVPAAVGVGAIGLVLSMGLNVFQCVHGKAKGPKGGSLVSLDYVYSLRCACGGCDDYPGFSKDLEIEKQEVSQ